MRRLLFESLTAVGLVFGCYWVWAESGPYEFLGSIQVASTGKYVQILTLYGTFLTVLVPMMLISRPLFDVDPQTMGAGYVGIAGLTAALALFAISGFECLTDRPITLTGEAKQLFAGVSMVPRTFLATFRQLPPLETKFIVGVTTQSATAGPSRPSPFATDIYAPLDPRCWPNPTTPVIFKTKPYGLKPDGSVREYYAVLQPVPFLVRQKWKADRLHLAVVVSDLNVASDFWGRYWCIALGLGLGGVRALKGRRRNVRVSAPSGYPQPNIRVRAGPPGRPGGKTPL